MLTVIPTTLAASADDGSGVGAGSATRVFACARGRTNAQVASELRLTKQPVGTWRGRFLVARLDRLLDEPPVGTAPHHRTGRGDDVVGLYLGPPVRALVPCADENA